MNILLFVTSMLMLLTLMTYGRIESYKGFAFTQIQFKEYMQKAERSYINKQAKESYDHEKGSFYNKQKPTNKNPASSKLSFNLFVDRSERMKQMQFLDTQRVLVKNLIYFLYSEQPFFKRLEEKRSGFVDEILDALIRVTDAYPEEKKIDFTQVGQLATIDLGDPELNEVFTIMMRGSADVDETPPQMQNSFLPAYGYNPLLALITLQKNKLKLRVFLAAPQLLMSLYGNPQLVQEIIDLRKVLRSGIANESITQEVADKEFASRFANQQLPSVPDAVLDFGTSSTLPQSGY